MFTVFKALIKHFAYILLLNIHSNLSGMYYYYPQFIDVVKELVPNLSVSCLRYNSGGLFTEPRFCAMGKTAWHPASKAELCTYRIYRTNNDNNRMTTTC